MFMETTINITTNNGMKTLSVKGVYKTIKLDDRVKEVLYNQ